MSLLDALLLDPFPLDAWIAPRTDGVLGSGTEDDPYDGSTQGKFDAVMSTTLASRNNIRVQLGPGLFQTLGYHYATPGWQPFTGWKIIGAGMEVTTLRLIGAAKEDENTPYLAIGAPSSTLLNCLEVSDLTIDCNASGQTVQKVACGAVQVAGSHNRLRRIRAINFGTQTALDHAVECFVLAPTYAQPNSGSDAWVDCWIDNCIIEQPGLQNTKESTLMIMLAGEAPPNYTMAYHRACVIRNNFVNSEYRDKPVPITSIEISGGIAKVTTRLPHGRAVGDYVRITGALLGGSANNSYNGSYPVLSVTPPDATPPYELTYRPNPTQTVNPTGDIWLGRFPSQVISITNIAAVPSGTDFTVTVTTLTPHFLAPGDTVVINNVTSNKTPPNGPFSVSGVSPWSPTQFTYTVHPDPGTISLNPNEFVGILSAFQACSADGGTAAVVEGNRFLNAAYGGPYHDTWSSKDVTVRNNYHRAVVSGPYQNLGNTNASRNCTLTNTGTIATLSTQGMPLPPHGLVPGETAFVTGANQPEHNGFFVVVSVPTTTQLTYQMASDPAGPATGNPTFARLWQVRHLVFENNIIEVLLSIFQFGYDPPIGINFYNSKAEVVVPPTYCTNELVIRRNVIRSLDGALDPWAYPIGIRPLSCAKGLIEEDVIDLNSLYNGPPILQIQCGAITYLNNQTSAGKLIQGWIHETQQYVDELSTLIDFASITAF